MSLAKEIPLLALGITKTRSVCGYCGVGCSVDILSKNDRILGIQPAMDGPANEGALCVKGQFAFDYVHHPERLKAPLVRRADGKLHETTWEEALTVAAAGFRARGTNLWPPRYLWHRLGPHAHRSRLSDAEVHPRWLWHAQYRQL